MKNEQPSNIKDSKTRTKVRIMGQEYVVRGACSGDQIRHLAGYVDKLMEEVRMRSPNLPLNKLMVLVSLNLAEELFKVKNDYESLLQTLEEEQRK